MDVEDFIALAEVSDYVEDLLGWIAEVASDGSYAEVEAVVGAGGNIDEFLQAFYGSQDSVDSSIALGWDAGVMGMTGHLDLVFRRHRDNPFEEIGDSLPE